MPDGSQEFPQISQYISTRSLNMEPCTVFLVFGNDNPKFDDHPKDYVTYQDIIYLYSESVF